MQRKNTPRLIRLVLLAFFALLFLAAPRFGYGLDEEVKQIGPPPGNKYRWTGKNELQKIVAAMQKEAVRLGFHEELTALQLGEALDGLQDWVAEEKIIGKKVLFGISVEEVKEETKRKDEAEKEYKKAVARAEPKRKGAVTRVGTTPGRLKMGRTLPSQKKDILKAKKQVEIWRKKLSRARENPYLVIGTSLIPSPEPITATGATIITPPKLITSVPKQKLSAEKLFQKVSPAVVRIVAKDKLGKDFATGSGFIISPDGFIVTCHHVIAGAAKVEVVLHDKTRLPVVGVAGLDIGNDLAILKVNKTGLPFINTFGIEKPKTGYKVYAIGNPLGLTNTLSDGVISGIRQFSEVNKNLGNIDMNAFFIQTSAAISPGSSGGLLIGESGEALGVTVGSFTEGQALNFVVPAVRLKKLIESCNQLVPVSDIPLGGSGGDVGVIAWVQKTDKKKLLSLSLGSKVTMKGTITHFWVGSFNAPEERADENFNIFFPLLTQSKRFFGVVFLIDKTKLHSIEPK